MTEYKNMPELLTHSLQITPGCKDASINDKIRLEVINVDYDWQK